MAGALWEDCDMSDETVKLMVTSFCRNFTFDRQMQQDQGSTGPQPQADNLRLQRFRDSYMNHVIRIRLKRNPDLGFILKLAPPRMQCPGLTLEAPVERGENEYLALNYFHRTVTACVPLPVFYDKAMHTVCTRELTGFQSLSERILTGPCSEPGARAFGATLAAIHSATHVLKTGKKGLQDLLPQFRTLDAMVSLIRIFHYERPFDPEDPGKRCAPEVKPLLRGLYDDVTVMETVQRVKRMFVEDKECLIHGDLHVDSVIVKDDDFKMVDAEFARDGPAAYDMGLLLATLLLLYHHQRHVQHVSPPQSEVKVALSEQKHIEESSPLETRSHSSAEGGAGQQVVSQLFKGTEEESSRSRGVEERSGCSGGFKGEGRCSGGVVQECGHSGGVEEILPDGRSSEAGGSGPGKAQSVLSMCSAMLEEYVGQLRGRLQQDETFSDKVVHDISAFAACELLSCIIGPSHFDFMDDSSQAQVDGVTSALRLLRELDTVHSVKDVIALVSSQPQPSSRSNPCPGVARPSNEDVEL